MSQQYRSRSSSHPYIDTVWQADSLKDGVYHATPDGSWDLIFSEKPDGKRLLFFSGQDTTPVSVPYVKGEKSLVISLTASTYLHPKPEGFVPLSISGDTFQYGGFNFPTPTAKNAEDVIDLLVQHGVLRNDEIVQGVLSNKQRAASKRSIQEHFRKATGITKKDFEQISRAQEAVRLLKQGTKPAEAATLVGYTDQAHMIRSLKKIMGRLPSDVSDVHKL